jgi:hypothetical protein
MGGEAVSFELLKDMPLQPKLQCVLVNVSVGTVINRSGDERDCSH